jgi:MFS transporter, DHA2 family, multidrug resistance protein
MLKGPFAIPSFNSYIPRKLHPWLYLPIAFLFLMSGGIYSGAMSQVMGEYSLMREDVLMIVMFNVVGVAMPFPFLFKMKFHFTNRQLLINAALVVAACNFLIMWTDSVPVMCLLAYLSGFFKLCGCFEVMSTIQLWMTKKRDFTIFFPLLYCFVLGNMYLTPWVTEHLIYIYQDWRIFNWFMTAAMLGVALFLYVTTHDFRFMKPMPFISVDYLGCILWSAWMLECIFFFNYGEHYNWLDAKVMRIDLLLFIVTGYFCIQRMRHIRHAYIVIGAWKYKRLVPLLILFAFVEFMDSTPKVLQTAFTGSVLHYGTFTTNVLNFVEWVGSIAGCLFCLFWCQVLRQKYTYLLTIGVAMMAAYPVMMYFIIDPGLPLEALYVPTLLRSFGHAIFFCILTIYLEELMPFQHFFMGLTIAGLIRNGPISTMCSGLYSFGLRYQMADNMARGLPYDSANLLMISIRQLYGVTCVIGLAVFLIFLLWNVQPVRSTLKKMPTWNFVGRMMKKKERRH